MTHDIRPREIHNGSHTASARIDRDITHRPLDPEHPACPLGGTR